jgi:hypothetical protein
MTLIDGDESRTPTTKILESIAGFVEYLSDTRRLRALTERGLGGLFGVLKLSENSLELSGDKATQDQIDGVVRMRRWTDAAQVEIDSDFALMHGHALMGAWGALEAMVDDVARTWISHSNSVATRQVFLRLKVNIGEFMAMSEEEQASHLLEEVRRDKAAGIASGLGQFERILAPLGVDGPVDPGIRRALFFAQQLRNVIAHRGAVADRRFVDACPTLGYAVGDRVRITSPQFFDIVAAMEGYAVMIADRVRPLLGLPPTGLNLPGNAGHTFGVDKKSEHSAPEAPTLLE